MVLGILVSADIAVDPGGSSAMGGGGEVVGAGLRPRDKGGRNGSVQLQGLKHRLWGVQNVGRG